MIFNPTARGEKAKNFRKHLDEIGKDCALKLTTAPGDARRLAAEAVGENYEVIVAAGGDGTLNEVLNGIGDVADGFERARLGVLPLGTVNVFARELKIPLDLNGAWKTILHGRDTQLDLPRIEYAGKTGRERCLFAQLAGAGLDARAIELVNWPLKKKVGPLAYVAAGFQALAGEQTKITVSSNGHSLTGELVLIGNGRLYGGQFVLFPEADLRDGMLDVCVFSRADWLTLLRCGPSLVLSGELPVDSVSRLRGDTFEMACPTPAPMQVDGELLGHLPATIRVERGRLRVLAP